MAFLSQMIAPGTNGGCKIPNYAWSIWFLTSSHIYVCRRAPVHLRSAEGDSLPISPGANDFSEPDSRISQVKAHAQVLSKGWSTLEISRNNVLSSHASNEMRSDHYKSCIFANIALACMVACQTTEHQTMVLLFQAQVSKTISKTMDNTMRDPGWCFMLVTASTYGYIVSWRVFVLWILSACCCSHALSLAVWSGENRGQNSRICHKKYSLRCNTKLLRQGFPNSVGKCLKTFKGSLHKDSLDLRYRDPSEKLTGSLYKDFLYTHP